MLCTSQEPTVLWPLARLLPLGNSNPTLGWEAEFICPCPLKLPPSGRLLIMEAMVASVKLGVHSRKGSGGSEESIASQAPSLSPSVFPASLSLLELTLARSRELPLNYLTLSHIGLLASGRKSFSEQSSIFFLSAFRWVPFSQSVSVSSWTLLRP